MDTTGEIRDTAIHQHLKDSALYNDDLAPATAQRRTWGTYNYMALWVGMSHCIPTYMMASGMIAAGLDWKQALLIIALGNVIVLLPMLLNSYAGTKYGIPFPVLCRSSFGVLGANIPAMLRAVVACGWFGIQTWIGGDALDVLMAKVWPAWSGIGGSAAFDGVAAHTWIAFSVFWLLNMLIVWRGMESIRKFENWAAPSVLVVTVALLIWMVRQAHGFGPILSEPSHLTTFKDLFPVFMINLTGAVGFWATLSLNMPDFTRFSKGQAQQMVGQALGLPTTMVFFSALGILITSATAVVYGAPIWDPIELMKRFDSPLVIAIALVTIAVATLSVNVAANIVSPSFDFSNLAPKKISFKLGGVITGLLGIFMMPWKLLHDFGSYIFGWLVGYSAFLGPIAGIMICDFWIVQKRTLDLQALYNEDGRYRYGSRSLPALILMTALLFADFAMIVNAFLNLPINPMHSVMQGMPVAAQAWVVGLIALLPAVYLAKISFTPGFNWRANMALILGISATLISLKETLGDLYPPLMELYKYAWFLGFGVSFVTYWLLMLSHKQPAAEAPAG